jgi:hypothetical protein
MFKLLIEPYIKRLVEIAFLMVKVWAWVLTIFFIYAVFSSFKWYENVQHNAELEIELVKNKSRIDSIKIYQQVWQRENEVLRTKINALEVKIYDLDANLNKDLKNDEKPIFSRDIPADDVLRIFTNRYGKGSARYSPIRADTAKYHSGHQRK